MLKRIILLLLSAISLAAFSQKPTITSIDKTKGAFADVITIKGTDFGTDKSKLKVYFGPVPGTIKSVSNQLMLVSVPAGTTYDKVSVTNTSNGLTGYSPSQFLLSFNGAQGLSAANFTSEFQRAADAGLYDLALGDFNGDNLTDVVCASDQFNSLAILYNGSTATTLNFTKNNNNLLSNIKTFHITTGDLNGDGRLDIVASEADGTGTLGNKVVIYRNLGSLNWSIQSVTLTGRKVKRVAIADLDLDGKPEVIVTDKSSNIISILPNQSTLSAIIFGGTKTITVADAASTDALQIEDMNGDGTPDIITSQFNAPTSNIFICSNKSTPGNFNLSDVTTFTVASTVINLRVGDLDGDQKPDVVATRLLDSEVAVFRNTSTNTQFKFAPEQLFRTNVRPWGVELGDLDGDGKTDIAVCSIDNSGANKTLTLLNNTSTMGNISFAEFSTINTQFINRNLRIGDMNGDAKPDIVFTSIDDNALGIPASRISIFRNKSCLIPTITPAGPVTVCSGNPLKLLATSSPGTQYAWTNGGTATGGATAQLDVTASGSYSVTATSEGGACAISATAPVSVTVSAANATLTATPTPSSNTPVCTGSTLQLTMNDVGATEYRWSGPNAYLATGITASRPSFTAENAGIYTVDLVKGGTLAAGGCIAQTDSILVSSIFIPTFTINFSGSDLICKNTSKVISLSPVLTSGFSYSWFNGSTLVNGETGPTFTVKETGEYSARVVSTLGSCTPQTTPAAKITVLELPALAFTTTPATICSGTTITFSNQSTVDSKAVAPNAPSYSWIFGDGGTSNLASPTYAYTVNQTSPQTFTVFLTGDYTGLTGCSKTISKSIVIQPAVKPVITSAKEGICSGETKVLTVAGTFTSITWSTGATGASISITQPGTITATTVDANGCSASAQLVLALKPNPTVLVSSDKDSVPLGQSVQLTASGAETYSWTPVATLDNPLIATPKATPVEPTVYTVSAKGSNGCATEQSIAIDVTSEPSNLKITNVFTPNGDGKNDLWVISGIEFYSECTLSLFDRNGSKILEQKGYKNDWDGTYNGKPVPEGTYYYLLSCSDKKPETGNVLVAR